MASLVVRLVQGQGEGLGEELVLVVGRRIPLLQPKKKQPLLSPHSLQRIMKLQVSWCTDICSFHHNNI